MEGTLGYDVTKVFTAAEMTAADPNKLIPRLGTRTFDASAGFGGKGYRFVKAGATGWASGDVIIRDFAGADEPNTCLPCSAVAQAVAGVAVSAVAAGGGGWIQIEGEHAAINCAASTAGQILGTTATVGRSTGIVASAGANPTQAEANASLAATQFVRITALDVAAANVAQGVIHS